MGISSKDFKINNNNPGPGNYNTDIKTKGSSYLMKKDNSKYAHENFFLNTNKTPSPGDYDPNNDLKFKSISYSMRSKANINKENNYPGPGSYNNLQIKSSAPQFS
jgi:hypothetical protein